MDWIVKFAEGFKHLFELGGEVFLSWMTGIVPLVLMLLVAMNAVTTLIGENRIYRLAEKGGKNVFFRYLILPVIATFTLGNPMSLSLGKYLPERYKPGWVAVTMQANHTSNGVFPHINPGELFVWLGIATGIEALGFNLMDLAIRYMLVGIVMNFVGGYVTDFIVAHVSKQQGVTLSKTIQKAE